MKIYKVYEIEDNVEDYSIEKEYPKHFAGAFESQDLAEKLCEVIDIADCNSTEVVFEEITLQDLQDVRIYGLKGYDAKGSELIVEAIKTFQPEIYQQHTTHQNDEQDLTK